MAVGCIPGDDEARYRAVVDSFVMWCQQNHLQLNVRKAGADHSCLRARGTNRNMHNIKFTYVIDLELGALKNLSVYLWL